MKLSEHFIVHKTDIETILVPVGGTDFSGVMKGNAILGDILSVLKEETTEEGIVKAHFQVGFWTAIIAATTIAAMGVLAGLAPALRAMSIKPVDAMRDE